MPNLCPQFPTGNYFYASLNNAFNQFKLLKTIPQFIKLYKSKNIQKHKPQSSAEEQSYSNNIKVIGCGSVKTT